MIEQPPDLPIQPLGIRAKVRARFNHSTGSLATRAIYGSGNCATAGDFGTDPLCSRLRLKQAVGSTATWGQTGSLPIAVQRFNANHSRAEKPLA
jgi:hypothetical protein